MTRLYDWIVGCFGYGGASQLRDRDACDKLYFWAYLWPRLKYIIRPLPQHPLITNSNNSAEDPFEFISTLSLVALGQEINSKLRIRATKNFLKEINTLTRELEREIEELERDSEEALMAQKN